MWSEKLREVDTLSMTFTVFAEFLDPYFTMSYTDDAHNPKTTEAGRQRGQACLAVRVCSWAVQRSWFSRVNDPCNLLHKKSQEVVVSVLG